MYVSISRCSYTNKTLHVYARARELLDSKKKEIQPEGKMVMEHKRYNRRWKLLWRKEVDWAMRYWKARRLAERIRVNGKRPSRSMYSFTALKFPGVSNSFFFSIRSLGRFRLLMLRKPLVTRAITICRCALTISIVDWFFVRDVIFNLVL